MTDNELLKAIESDDTDQLMLAALHNKLDSELEKPDDELDIDKINQITATIDIITGADRITAEKTQQGIQRLKQELRQKSARSRIHVIKWVAVCACLILVISNVLTYSVYGTNVLSAAYKVMTNGVVIDLESGDTEPYNANAYYDDMRSLCRNNAFSDDVLLPTYIPEGFMPTSDFGTQRQEGQRNVIYFFFKNSGAKLNITIIENKSEENIQPIGIPSTEYNISEQMFGDTIVHIQKERKDHQYWAVFQIDLTQYIIVSDGLDYDECQRVLESVFETES